MNNKHRLAHWVFFLLSIALLVVTALLTQKINSQKAQFNQEKEQMRQNLDGVINDYEELNEEKHKLEQEKEQLKKDLEAKKQRETQLATKRNRVAYAPGCETYRNIFSQYNWNVETAIKVCTAESGGNVYAANWTDNHRVCTGSFGLMQISCHSGQVYDPQQNIQIAYQKYQYGGWYQPWKNTCLKIGCPS